LNDVVIAYLGQASNLILDYEIDLLNLFISSIILSALYSMYKKPDYGLGIISMDTSFRDICHYMQEKDVRALLLGSFALLIPDLIVLFLISLVFGLKKIKQQLQILQILQVLQKL